MRSIAAALLLTIAAATAATCSGGGSPKPTPTPSDFAITAAYFRALNKSVTNAFAVPTDPPDPTPVPETTALTEPTVLPLEQDVAALRAFESALESVQPPPAASAAHQALLDATRSLVALQDPARATTTPLNEATATAQTASAEKRFRDACVDLSLVGQDADSPVELPCPEEEPPSAPPTGETPLPAESPSP